MWHPKSVRVIVIPVAALAVGLALCAATLVIALGVRPAAAGPNANPGAPNPGHAWTEIEGHGIDSAGWWLGAPAGTALELRVNGARTLRLEYLSGISPNVIAGYSGNSVTADAYGTYGATIGGGGSSGNTNSVTDNYGTVGGGSHNQAGDNAGTTSDATYATVGGGYGNTAGGQSTVAGGYGNTASGTATTVGGGYVNTASDNGTVAGGYRNQASYLAAVGGGASNHATGQLATVPGGQSNLASGNYSFAAGYGAQAVHLGAFVWADTTASQFASLGNNTFQVRASGGTYFYSSPGLGTGVQLAAGSGSWSSVSDRNLKDNFTPVDGQQVLASLADIPITTWNYKAQDPSIRHMGPVAQDFSAAFGLGEDNLHISTVDADGVALAGIQGLYQLSQEQASRIQTLEDENASLKQGLDSLETRVTAMEGANGTSDSSNSASAGLFSSGLSIGWLPIGGLLVAGLVLVQRRRTGGKR